MTELQRVRALLAEECPWCAVEREHSDGSVPCADCRIALALAWVIWWTPRVFFALVAGWLLFCVLASCSSARDAAYDMCRSELTRKYVAGEPYVGPPTQCEGISNPEIERILSNVIDSAPPPSTLD